jgi:hypothetical protein
MAKFHIGMKKLANRFAEHGDVKTLAAIDKLLGVMESANGVTSGAADASPLLAESKIGMLDWYFKKRLSQLDEELTPTVQPPSSAATEAGMGGQEDE